MSSIFEMCLDSKPWNQVYQLDQVGLGAPEGSPMYSIVSMQNWFISKSHANSATNLRTVTKKNN